MKLYKYFTRYKRDKELNKTTWKNTVCRIYLIH
jgi:hypothetical protein